MILGVFTTTGISETRFVEQNRDFVLYVQEFGVSSTAGTLDPARTGPNADQWYVAPISSRVVEGTNSVKVICTIPVNASPTSHPIKEIYLYAKNSQGQNFLLALGQPTENIVYEPTTSVTFELQLELADTNLTDKYVFNYTQATEISEHNEDPNAHPQLMQQLSYAGIFLPMGGYQFQYNGQNYIQPVEFGGTNSTGTYNGVVWSAQYNGTEGNSTILSFNGVDSNLTVQSNWNTANKNNPVVFTGSPNTVSPAGTLQLSGGTYTVQDRDLVYKDVDGLFKSALADTSIKSRVDGQAILANREIVGQGYIQISSTFNIGEILSLTSDPLNPGKFVTGNTGVPLGLSLGSNVVYFAGYGAGAGGGGGTGTSYNYDAIVSNLVAPFHYFKTQNAIDAVGSGSSILIDKLEIVDTTIQTNGKVLTIDFNGPSTGWKRSLGQNQIWLISFTAVPTSGTWRIEWNGQQTNNMPYNATAADVQAQLNLLSGGSTVVVTGDYSVGFSMEILGSVSYGPPTFNDPGTNDIQRFDFSNVPNNGTCQWEYNGDTSVFIAFNDLTPEIHNDLVTSLTDVNGLLLTGSFAAQYFQLEAVGPDAKQPRFPYYISFSDLNLSGANTQINSQPPTAVPIQSILIQAGTFPADNLYAGTAFVYITATETQQVAQIGQDTCFLVENDNILIRGDGVVEDFPIGINLQTYKNIVIEARFPNTTLPVKTANQVSGPDYQVTNSQGYSNEISGILRVTPHPTDPYRVIISPSQFLLYNASLLTASAENLMVEYAGGQIDFDTGTVYAADGTTVISTFTVPAIPAGEWLWFSISLSEAGVTATNQTAMQPLMLVAPNTGATQETAPRAEFADNMAVGEVAIQGTSGKQEISQIITINDVNGSLNGTYFLLYDTAGDSYCFWINEGGATQPAIVATFYVEITGIVANDNSVAVASIIMPFIDAQAAFSATVALNRINITCVTVGPTTDISSGTTGFFVGVIQQGQLPNVSGIEGINSSNIAVTGGSGSGGGGGSGWKTYPKLTTFDCVDGGTIPIERKPMQYWRVKGATGPVTLSLTPFGTPAIMYWKDGYAVRLIGMSDTAPVNIQWSGTTDLGVDCNGNISLGNGDIVELQFDLVRRLWGDPSRNF